MGGALDQNSVFRTQQDHCPQELTEQNLLKSKPGDTSMKGDSEYQAPAAEL